MNALTAERHDGHLVEWHAHSRLRFENGSLAGPHSSNRELAMHRIIQANIDRFKQLLQDETDPMKRAMELRLLAEEEAKLAAMPEKKKA